MSQKIERLVLDFCGQALLDFANGDYGFLFCGNDTAAVVAHARDLELELLLADDYKYENRDELENMAKYLSVAEEPGFDFTREEIFDQCLLLLRKQAEIELPRPLPDLDKYDEKRRPYYQLCGDVLLLLAKNIKPKEIVSWAAQQLYGRPDRYTDIDNTMKYVLGKLSLRACHDSGLTEGEIFLLAMGLLAKSPGREGEK
jgi:hypothetical protein